MTNKQPGDILKRVFDRGRQFEKVLGRVFVENKTDSLSAHTGVQRCVRTTRDRTVILTQHFEADTHGSRCGATEMRKETTQSPRAQQEQVQQMGGVSA